MHDLDCFIFGYNSSTLNVYAGNSQECDNGLENVDYIHNVYADNSQECDNGFENVEYIQ